MTDKELIIDGVDVSGCEYYNRHWRGRIDELLCS